MSDDNVYNQRKIKPEEIEAAVNHDADSDDGLNNPLSDIQRVQRAVAQETGNEAPRSSDSMPFAVSGNIPPEFQAVLAGKSGQQPQENTSNGGQVLKKKESKFKKNKPNGLVGDANAYRTTGSDKLEEALSRLAEQHHWETFTWPSKGKFYENIPETVHIRPMTGEEEQILATPRFVKRGMAIDMIFQKCIKENFRTNDLLSVDRNKLLIYLRGISYTPEYDVEIKCTECSQKFATVIDLNMLEVEECPDDFNEEDLVGVLPVSGFQYKYRLSTGSDEQAISTYRDKRISKFGDQSEDDTLLYRTAILMEEIEGIRDTREIQHLLKKLSIADVAHLRNEVTAPPFGVDTELLMMCPSCNEEFLIELPLETNFFFPRKKKENEAQA